MSEVSGEVLVWFFHGSKLISLKLEHRTLRSVIQKIFNRQILIWNKLHRERESSHLSNDIVMQFLTKLKRMASESTQEMY